MGNKSVLTTYLLWMMLGWLGVHHLYLRRYRHGFVWLWTLGGCCGVGWLLEFWRLSSYIDIANNRVSYKHRTGVSFSWKRFTGELVFSMLLGVLSVSAIPKDVLTLCPMLSTVAVVFVAAGVYTAANIDHNTECSYVTCLLGACVPIPILLFSLKLDTFLTYSCLCSVVGANLYGTQSRQRTRYGTCRPVAVGREDSSTQQTHSVVNTSHSWMWLCAANLLMTVMLISSLYHNCSVTTRDGTEVPLRDAIHNMIVSPAWSEVRLTAGRLFHCLVHEGLRKFVSELRIVLDPEGENSAYRVLGFTDWSQVTENQLTERYRQLVRQFHPDKVNVISDVERRRAERRFIVIQQAYEKLSVIKRRRADRTDL